eukprot:gb/GEZN01003557.1/.p1 GENE.gb/GEZN01003557.1/~~gb/GEZN01003557.1/.p1  ORF type:complete len:647 (+),score=100.86 gb/GEZN01003557.1/:258-1943(+)
MIAVFYVPDPTEQQQQALLYGGAFVLVGLVRFLTVSTAESLFSLVSSRLTARVRLSSLTSMLFQDMSWFDLSYNNSHNLTTQLAVQAPRMQQVASRLLSELVFAAAAVTASFIVALTASPRLSWVLFLFFPLIVLAQVFQVVALNKTREAMQNSYEEAAEVVSEALEDMRALTSSSAETTLIQAYTRLLEKPHQQGLRRAGLASLGVGTNQLITYSMYALCFGYGSQLLAESIISLTDLLQVFFAVVMAGQGVTQLAVMMLDLDNGRQAANEIFSLLDSSAGPLLPTADLQSASRPGHQTIEQEKEVLAVKEAVGKEPLILSQVDFRYPTRPRRKVLRHFNLSVPAGRTVALVGKTGSGKSSVLSLLTGLYMVERGSVQVGGQELKNLQTAYPGWRSAIGSVPQEPRVFRCSVLDNIRLGRPNLSMAKIRQSAIQSKLHEVIQALPQQYNTILGPGAAQLSGGEKQRLAIARALAGDPSVLLLDEATSALDSTTEKDIALALEQAGKTRTVLVIAHRLSTIRNADLVCVIERGRVVEAGTHLGLLHANGRYAELLRQTSAT